MIRVALTGGIATGKTHVRERLDARGIPTIDADGLARDVVEPNTPGWRAVVARFGTEVVGADGRIDRRKLAALVFADPAARRALEEIVHPLVYQAIADWFATLPPDTVLAVADIPLLFETGRQGDFDAIIVTACSPDEQMRRLSARAGVTREEAEQRLAAQWPIGPKVRRADFVIRTDGSFEETERQVEEAVTALAAADRR